MLTDLFVAPLHGHLEMWAELGGVESGKSAHAVVRAKLLEPVVLNFLGEAVGFRGWVGRASSGDDSGDALFFDLGPRTTQRLSECDSTRLRQVGEEWMRRWTADLATIPAYNGEVPAGEVPRLDGEFGWWPVLEQIAELARTATERGERVYLFVSP